MLPPRRPWVRRVGCARGGPILLRGLYGPEKEALGVLAIEIELLDQPML
jgi:hypothetical protein